MTGKQKDRGGFHKFAEYTSKIGVETVFFSFARPYYSLFKKTERLNKKVLFELTKGKEYKVGSNSLLNITFPTLALPGPLRKFIPESLDVFLQRFSFKSFNKFSSKYLANSNYFIFESNESLLLFDKIKKKFPDSKLIYRPSDPILTETSNNYLGKLEKKVICKADLVLIVNKEGLDLYRKAIADFDSIVKYKLLSNGVDLESYKKNMQNQIS
ncbi:hypothetical protein [Polaribacter sejongensis]|uniref:GumK N-terminal domain-containing glycosyltransferase n=1 Tax=Polaribacter sejongensis TaxID=985043 RepID=UPI0035A6E9D3